MLAAEEGAEPPARAKALCGAGLMAWLQDDHGVARSHLEESVALWWQLGDKRGLAQSLRILSHAVLGRVDPAVARSMAEESVQLFREGEDEFGLATSLATLGLVALSQEDYEAAWPIFEESVAICRQSGDDWALALALRNQAIGAIKRADYERAAVRLRESLIAHRDPGDVLYTVTLDLLAAAISMQGGHGRAARLFGLAEALREEIGASVVASVRADYDRGVGGRKGDDPRRSRRVRPATAGNTGTEAGFPSELLPRGLKRPRGRGLEAGGQRDDQRPDSQGALYQPAHRKLASKFDLPQAGLQLACRGYPLRPRT